MCCCLVRRCSIGQTGKKYISFYWFYLCCLSASPDAFLLPQSNGQSTPSVQFTIWLLLISLHVFILHLLVYLIFPLEWNATFIFHFSFFLNSWKQFFLEPPFLCCCCRTTRTQHTTSGKGLVSAYFYHPYRPLWYNCTETPNPIIGLLAQATFIFLSGCSVSVITHLIIFFPSHSSM